MNNAPKNTYRGRETCQWCQGTGKQDHWWADEPFQCSICDGRGWWLPHGQPAEEYWKTILAAGGWFDPFYDYHDRSGMSQHPDGRVWIFPAEARRRLRDSGEQLAEGFLPIHPDVSSDEASEDALALRLVPYRVLTLASGGTSLMPWLLENLGVLIGRSWEVWVEVHPETARKLGVEANIRVRVTSR